MIHFLTLNCPAQSRHHGVTQFDPLELPPIHPLPTERFKKGVVMSTTPLARLHERFYRHEAEILTIASLSLGLTGYLLGGLSLGLTACVSGLVLAGVVSSKVTPPLPSNPSTVNPKVLGHLDQLAAAAHLGRVYAYSDPNLGHAEHATLTVVHLEQDESTFNGDLFDGESYDGDFDDEIFDEANVEHIDVVTSFKSQVFVSKRRVVFAFSEGVDTLEGPARLFVTRQLATQLGWRRWYRQALGTITVSLLLVITALASSPLLRVSLGAALLAVAALGVYPILSRRAVLDADVVAAELQGPDGVMEYATMLACDSRVNQRTSLLRQLLSTQPTPRARVAALFGRMTTQQREEFQELLRA